MSFSTVYDSVVDNIELALPNHKRLYNPYSPEDNDKHRLTKGWGLRVGEDANINDVSCSIFLDQSIQIVVTRLFRGVETDVSRKASVEKALQEDKLELIKRVCNNEVTDAAGLGYVGNNGTEFVRGTDRDNYLMLVLSFTLKYEQSLN